MSRSRAKGTAHETAIVRHLNAHGYPGADRAPLRGNKDQGDIVGIPGVCIEAKNCKTLTPSLWLDQLEVEMINSEAETGVVIAKRRGTTDIGKCYALMTVDTWLALLKEAGR